MDQAVGSIVSALNTYVPLLAAVIFLWLVLKVFQDDIKSTLQALFRELRSLAKLQWSFKSLNALITIIAGVLVLMLPRSITIPTAKDAIEGIYLLGAILAFLVVFAVLTLMCLHIVRHEK